MFKLFKKKPVSVSASAAGGVKPQEGDHEVFRNGKWVYEQVGHATTPTEISTITIKVGAGMTGFAKASDSQAPCRLTGGNLNLSIAHGQSTMPLLVTVYRYGNGRLTPIPSAYSFEPGVVHFDDYVSLVGVDPSVIVLVFRGLA